MSRPVKIRQRDITDCGAACLASVSAHYRLKVPVSRIRQYAGTDKSGTNVLGLTEAAEKLGFQARGVKGPLESLQKIPLPAIAHVKLVNGLLHYVVIYRVSKKRITLMDPGGGKLKTQKLSSFAIDWTGVLVLLLPDEKFTSGGSQPGNMSRFWHLIKPHSGIMFQAMLGAMVYTMLGLATSVYLQKIMDHVLPEGNTRLLNLLSTLMIILLVFQLFTGIFKSILGLQTGQHIDARLILGYYKHLLRLPQRFFDTMRVGEIISRVNDAVKIRVFINETGLSIIVNLLMAFFAGALMLVYYWKLAIILFSIFPIYLVLYWIHNRINKKWQRTLMEKSADLEAQLVESLNVSGTLKRFGLESYANTKTENRFIILLRSVYQSSIKGLYLNTATEGITHLFTILILWAGSYFVIRRELTPGELFSFYALTGYFTSPAISLLGANKSIQDSLIAADRLFDIIDLETETTPQNCITLTTEMLGAIELDNVHFRYGTREAIFEGLTLRIEKNRTTAIVGESGSGKSTLLSLLQNLYPLQDGRIRIGGIDLQHISKQSLRQRVAVVPQKIDLFSGSIIENIALDDFEPDMPKILFLSQLLGIAAFVENMPSSYHTVLQEQGADLSGGQRQRIAIARALYRNPEILILDEATSSLDPESEQQVKFALEQFRQKGKTLVIIAHRLSTIKQADNIIVLEKGKLMEQGTHEALLSLKGKYAGMWHGYTQS